MPVFIEVSAKQDTQPPLEMQRVPDYADRSRNRLTG